jgi:hypothetical protein
MLVKFVGFLLVVNLFSFSGGPPDGYAGDPPLFQNCTACHISYPVNSGDGVLEIEGLPSFYFPDSLYQITVILIDTGQSRWGFELTVIDSEGFQAGILEPVDTNLLQVSEGPDSLRDYIKHRREGTFPGTDFGASWQIFWRAPSAGSGPAYFYVAGNAANNNGNSLGDYIYTFNTVVEETTAHLVSEKNIDFSWKKWTVLPNPLKGHANIILTLERPGEVLIEAFDRSGRSYGILFEGYLERGNHIIPIPLYRLDSAGLYYIRLSLSGKESLKPVVYLP